MEVEDLIFFVFCFFFLQDVQLEFHKIPVETHRSRSICEDPAYNMSQTVLCSR